MHIEMIAKLLAMIFLVNSTLIDHKVVAREFSGHCGFTGCMNFTIAVVQADNESFVVRTLNRKTLWEMQTPQVIKPELLKKGFELVNREGLEVTDDVSIVELLKHPVYITEGSYTNIKVTTPDDMMLAERILNGMNASISHDVRVLR